MSSHALGSRAGTSMPLLGRILRRTVCCLLGVVSGVCAAQQSPQVKAQPYVQSTGGRVTSLLAGIFQSPGNGVDVLYINAPAIINQNPSPTIVAGIMLDGNGFTIPDRDKIPFTNASNVVAALGDFNSSDGLTDFAFAISSVSTDNLCVYYGTGLQAALFIGNGVSSYEGGNYYPPQGGKSGCMTIPPPGGYLPYFAYIAALPLTTGGTPYLLVEDSANNLLYVIANNGTTGNNGALPGFKLIHTLAIPTADGPGPIYTGSFDNKIGNFDQHGNAFFIINGQTGHSATVYTSDGTGVFTAQPPLAFTNGVYSMLLQDMDGDGIPDMVVEGKDGSIEIFPGDGKGGFSTTSEGGTSAIPSPLMGNGGHLAAIGDVNNDGIPDILTTTPIGLSVLHGLGPTNGGKLNYTLKGIYNIGPGRSSFALASFANGDLAVDSAEGVAFIQGNADGSFQTSNAYSALAPALGATMGKFRTSGNPTNNVDVVVATPATNAVQGQLLTGDGTGAFTASTPPTNTSTVPSGIPNGLWSNILSGKFTDSGNLDLAYSLTGTPGSYSGSGLYVQYGKGNGTFKDPVAVTPSGSNNFYGESAVGLFDKSGNSGIANIDANYDDTLLWQSSNTFNVGLNLKESNTNFNQVAAGYLKVVPGQTGNQDLVFQQGATTLVPYENKQDGSGTFTAGTPLTVPSPVGNYAGNYAISAVLLTDIDNDGNGDILALYHNLASDPSNPSASTSTPNWLYIWFGDGTGKFVQSTPIQLSRNYYLAAVADMNGDTLPDIVLSDGYIVSILYSLGALSTPPNRSFSPDSPDTHFLAGQGINSLTLESVGGSTVPDLVVANGGATISNPIVLGGAAQTSATLPANPPDVNTGGITVLLNNITALQTTGTLTSTPPTTNIGEAFTITATLTPSSGNTPTGTVAFYLDGNPINGCSITVAPVTGTTTSTATCPVAAGNSYPGGTHTLTATYSGDPNNAVATLIGTHNIIANNTQTNLYLCVGPLPGCPSTGVINPAPPYVAALPMIYGQTFNGITEVSANDPNTLLGTTVLNDVYNGVQLPTLCTLPALGSNQCPVNVGTGTQVGVNVFTSSYVPGTADTTNGPSSSQPVQITVSADTPTVTVTSSLNPAPSGQAVTLTAKLIGANAPLGTTASPVGNYVPPTGTVVFMNGSTQIGTAPLTACSTCVSSTATYTTSTLPVGTDQITASYAVGQDINFNGATSAAFPETITKVNTTDFTVSATPNP
ncbi:MAG: FG-GAP-like repeat-containing protein, partial [Polyangia bacterium]